MSSAVIACSLGIPAAREGPAAAGSTGPSALRPTRRTSAASSNRIGADNVPEYPGHKKPQDVRNPEALATFALNYFRGLPSHVIVRGPPLCGVRRQEQSAMPEIIDLGSLRLRFLQSKDDTAGSIDIFEMTLQSNARMPIPHYHDRWDETIYGLTGTTTWRVDGEDRRDAWRNGLYQARHRPQLYQQDVRADVMPLHAEPGRARSTVLQGHGRSAGGRHA